MGRRWLLIGGAAALGLVSLGALFLFVIYGRVGAKVVTDKVIPKLEQRLGRDVEIGQIDVGRGLVVIEDLEVRGEHDAPGAPLVHIDRIEAAFDFASSLVGDIEIHRVVADGVAVKVVRGGGDDNISDLIAKLTGGGGTGAVGSNKSTGGRLARMRPEQIEVRSGSLEVRAVEKALTVRAEDFRASGTSGGALSLDLQGLSLASDFGPRAKVAKVMVTADAKDIAGSAHVALESGEVFLWRGMTLTGVKGEVSQGDAANHLAVAFEGGYGGAEGTLWRGGGWFDPSGRAGSIEMRAERFTFGRIAPVLKDTMVRDFANTSVDVAFKVDLEGDRIALGGQLDLRDLNLFIGKVSEEEIRDIDVSGQVAASFDRRARTLEVTQAAFETGGVPYSITGKVELEGGVLPDGTERAHRHIATHVVVPKTPCQKVLDAIPTGLVPYLQGFKLKGTFETDVAVDIDWADLEKTVLDGGVGIRGCKVVKAPPEMDAHRLLTTFKHEVEIEPDQWETIVIGPENPTFVPLADVSPYLLKSMMTTEDSSFYSHKGYISREFRTALVKNLEAGYFKVGASSITMQLVKNVLLHRVKTLSRKIQELFLAWYIESVVDKDRLFEIYVNAIEYGPGLYGIYPATYQYFGKHPRDLNPVEAAFFSSILPSPKRRYTQFCRGALTSWSAKKIERILNLMHDRERLTDEELALALATPLVFQPNKGSFCNQRIPEWDVMPVAIRKPRAPATQVSQ